MNNDMNNVAMILVVSWQQQCFETEDKRKPYLLCVTPRMSRINNANHFVVGVSHFFNLRNSKQYRIDEQIIWTQPVQYIFVCMNFALKFELQ